MRYLRRERPDVLISALDHVNVGAVVARRLARVGTRLIVAVHMTHSEAHAHSRTLARPAAAGGVRHSYRWADRIVTVLRGVADDMIARTGVPPEMVRVIYNPVISPETEASAAGRPVAHPWLAAGRAAGDRGVGRLTPQKDFPTLLRAFALLRQTRECRLLILGEGEERAAIGAAAGGVGSEGSCRIAGLRQ